MKGYASFTNYLSIIVKHRRKTIKSFLVFAIGALIVSFIIPVQYTATTSLLPPSSSSEGLFSLMSATAFSSFRGATDLSGILTGATSPSDLYAAILSSGTITSQIIAKYNLKKVFKARTMTDAGKMLNDITKITITPEGIIEISVTWFKKDLAADIANSYAEELDRFNTKTAMTAGKKYRIFIEQRLNEAQDSLTSSEIALRSFQEKNRTVVLDVEIESAISTIVKLKSEIMMKEVQRNAAASISNANNPYVINIDSELRELRRQLSRIEFGSRDTTKKEFGAGFSVPFAKLPSASLEFTRLIRDVKIQEAIYEMLTQQYEQAKIMEAKDTPTVQILDKASPPEKKSIPKRGRIVIFSAIWGVIFGLFLAFFAEWYDNIKKQPDEIAKISFWLSEIKKDLRYLKSKVLSIIKFRKSRVK